MKKRRQSLQAVKFIVALAAALLFYLFASYLFSGLFSHPGMPFSTTLLSKLLAVALAGALAARGLPRKRNSPARRDGPAS